MRQIKEYQTETNDGIKSMRLQASHFYNNKCILKENQALVVPTLNILE
jgi:hypothetical protein